MKKTALVALVFIMTGCTSMVKCEKPEGFSHVTYCMGKVSGDGQEGVFRDAFIDGQPVLSHFGSGNSLWGQVLQGAVGSALLAGGGVGAAAVLRPDRITNQVGSANSQGQSQEQSYEGYTTSGSASNSMSEGSSASSTSTTSSTAQGGNGGAGGSGGSSSNNSNRGNPDHVKHFNKSGGGDNTNPGGHGNDGGFKNPGKGK